jgi:hypothetical protein
MRLLSHWSSLSVVAAWVLLQAPAAPMTVTVNAPLPTFTSVTWTNQTHTSGWPGYNGYLDLRFDPVSKQTVLYGITSASGSIYSGDIFTYAYASNTWTHVGGSGHTTDDCSSNGSTWPIDRHPEQQAIDTGRNRFWLWSGVCANVNRQDLWYLILNADPTTDTWTQVSLSTLPTVGNSGAMVYDPDDDVLFLFGSDTGAQTHDNWVYCPTATTLSAAQPTGGCATANDWTEIAPVGGVIPSGVAFTGLWYDTVTKRVIQYAGQTGGGTPKNETWSYSVPTKTWTQVCSTGCTPPPVFSGVDSNHPPMAYISDAGQLLYRQVTNTGNPKDWIYNPSTDRWTALASNTGPVPASPAQTFYMAYDPTARRVIAFVKNASGAPDVWTGVVQ